MGDRLAVGACDDDGVCLVIGRLVCSTGAMSNHPEVEVSVVSTTSQRFVVVRWSGDRGGTDFWAAGAVEVWTTDARPRALLSVIDDMSEGEDTEDEQGQRDVCRIVRSVEVRDDGVRIGARTVDGRCDTWLEIDRLHGNPLGPEARTWTWDELAVRPEPAPPPSASR